MSLSFQYTIELEYAGKFEQGSACPVIAINTGKISHASDSYYENPINGPAVKHYVYGETVSEPMQITMSVTDGALVWLEWFTSLQHSKTPDLRNVTLKLYETSKSSTPQTMLGDLWMTWNLENCFPVSWQLKQITNDSTTSMEIEMKLQYEHLSIVGESGGLKTGLSAIG